jgi:hypothetical protein
LTASLNNVLQERGEEMKTGEKKRRNERSKEKIREGWRREERDLHVYSFQIRSTI